MSSSKPSGWKRFTGGGSSSDKARRKRFKPKGDDDNPPPPPPPGKDKYSLQMDARQKQAEATPPSAEFLRTLLIPPTFTCPHPNKRKREQLPTRLGFFRMTDAKLVYVESKDICQACLDLAAPQGFNTWSNTYTPFKGSSIPDSRSYFPPLFKAGTEDMDNPSPPPLNNIVMPANVEAQETFRYMQEQGQPFWIDKLHGDLKFDPNKRDGGAQGRAFARQNYPAYAGSKQGYIGTPAGGTGKNTLAEQRVLGDDRMDYLPTDHAGGAHPAMATHDSSLYQYPSVEDGWSAVPSSSGYHTQPSYPPMQGTTYTAPPLQSYQDPNPYDPIASPSSAAMNPPQANYDPNYDPYGPQPTVSSYGATSPPALEVPTNFPEGYTMPSEQTIDQAEYDLRGYVTGPTQAEQERRATEAPDRRRRKGKGK